MKIEIDLVALNSHLDYAPEIARALAVAVLSVLPDDQAELAVAEWRAVVGARIADCETSIEMPGVTVDEDTGDTLVQAVVPVDDATGGVIVRDIADTIPLEPPVCGSSTPIKDLHPHLSKATIGALTKDGFETLGQLADREPTELMRSVPRFGAKGAAELTAVMQAAGLWAELGQTKSEDLLQHVPRTEPEQTGNGEAKTGFEAMSTRELMKQAEHHLGRGRAMEFLEAQGVTKLSQLGDKEPALRAAVMRELGDL